MARRDLDTVWKALADPTRRRILDFVKGRARTTGEIADQFPMSRIAVMKHLAVLERARLVISKKDGRQRWNHLNAVPIRQIYERWVSRYESQWAASLVGLKRAVEKESGDVMTSTNVGAFHIEQEVQIEAPVEKVFEALTKGIDNWWRHRLSERPSRLSLDPQLGGLFVERTEDGEGAVWGTVVRVKKNEILELSGSLGMERPVSSLYRYTLQSKDRGTLLQLSHRVVGDLHPQWHGMYTEGWKALWVELDRWVTTGTRYDAKRD